jgi:hypothetical protein
MACQSTTFDNVRHEAVSMAVMTSSEGHHPLFCQRYPTRTCVAGNGEVRSSWNNVAPSVRRMAAKSASGRCDCQHQGGRGLGWCGMVNTRESPINVVNVDKRKVLIRLNQKVSGQDQTLLSRLAQTLHHRRIGGTKPAQACTRNVVSPMSSLWVEAPQGVLDATAGRGEGKKRKPPCNGVDRDLAPTRRHHRT